MCAHPRDRRTTCTRPPPRHGIPHRNPGSPTSSRRRCHLSNGPRQPPRRRPSASPAERSGHSDRDRAACTARGAPARCLPGSGVVPPFRSAATADATVYSARGSRDPPERPGRHRPPSPARAAFTRRVPARVGQNDHRVTLTHRGLLSPRPPRIPRNPHRHQHTRLIATQATDHVALLGGTPSLLKLHTTSRPFRGVGLPAWPDASVVSSGARHGEMLLRSSGRCHPVSRTFGTLRDYGSFRP